MSNYLTSSQIENFAKVGDTTRVPDSKIDTVLPRNADVLVRVNEAGNQLLPSSRVGTLVEALGLFGIGAQLYVQNDEPADSDAPAGQTEIPAGSIWISGAGSLRPEIRIANRISGLGWEFPDVGEIDFDQLPTNADTENRDVLVYNGSSWEARQLTAADIPSFAFSNISGQIDLSQFPNSGDAGQVIQRNADGDGWEIASIEDQFSENFTDLDGNIALSQLPTEGTGSQILQKNTACLLYTSPSPRDRQKSRMPSSA